MKLPTAAALLLLFLSLLHVSPAMADWYYDEAAFRAASGALISESFESLEAANQPALRDSIPDEADFCPGTAIPEGVPTNELKNNRYALTDLDTVFETVRRGNSQGPTFDLEDTAGCSCEQIIEALDLGRGHEKFGCSASAMAAWVALVSDD